MTERDKRVKVKKRVERCYTKDRSDELNLTGPFPVVTDDLII